MQGSFGQAWAGFARCDELARMGEEGGGQRLRGLDESRLERVDETRRIFSSRRGRAGFGASFGWRGARCGQRIDADGIVEQGGLARFGVQDGGCGWRLGQVEMGLRGAGLGWIGWGSGRRTGCNRRIHSGFCRHGLGLEHFAVRRKPCVTFGDARGD